MSKVVNFTSPTYRYGIPPDSISSIDSEVFHNREDLKTLHRLWNAKLNAHQARFALEYVLDNKISQEVFLDFESSRKIFSLITPLVLRDNLTLGTLKWENSET